MEAVVTMPGAEPWSALGRGVPGTTGVVVVHSLASSPAATRPLGQRLAAAGYAVEVPVLPGHGTSPQDLAGTRYRDWRDAVERLVDHLGDRCDRVVLVGHAAGGTLVLDLASARPDDVAAVAVINPLLLDRAGLAVRLLPLLGLVMTSVPRTLLGMPADHIALAGVHEQAYRRVPVRAVRSLLAQLPRVRAQLAALVAPLLVVHSPRDHTASSDALALLELAGSPHRRELVCERSYHLPQLDHDRELVERAVLELLAAPTGVS